MPPTPPPADASVAALRSAAATLQARLMEAKPVLGPHDLQRAVDACLEDLAAALGRVADGR